MYIKQKLILDKRAINEILLVGTFRWLAELVGIERRLVRLPVKLSSVPPVESYRSQNTNVIPTLLERTSKFANIISDIAPQLNEERLFGYGGNGA